MIERERAFLETGLLPTKGLSSPPRHTTRREGGETRLFSCADGIQSRKSTGRTQKGSPFVLVREKRELRS